MAAGTGGAAPAAGGGGLVIVVIDPGMASTNVGDQIISAAVDDEFVRPLRSRGTEVTTIPMHGTLTDSDRSLLAHATDVVVCGTNLLSDHMRFRSAWTWDRSDIALTAGRLTVLGAGWWQYQRYGVDGPTARWFRELAGSRRWAVRDEYSAERLRRARVPVLHTSCPTLWGVPKQTMPGSCTRAVVTMTDYSQDRVADQRLLALLSARFDEIVCWPQGPGDRAYFESLGVEPSRIIAADLDEFHAELDTPGTAYVGLRLHGGIRAMQRGVPTLIMSIDNRAREIARSVGLVAPSRHALTLIDELLSADDIVALRLPTESIQQWREQW